MKSCFYLSPESVWMFIKDCPEEPVLCVNCQKRKPESFRKQEHGSCYINFKNYEQALASAKQSAVKCADQERVCNILPKLVYVPDSLYPLPEGIRVEVRNFCRVCNEIGHRNCAHFDKCGNTESLAYIIEESKQEESQEKLWIEAYTMIAWQGFTDPIQKHFTITRKNQNP